MPDLHEPTAGDRVWWRGHRWFIRRRLRLGRLELVAEGVIAVVLRSQLSWDEPEQAWLLWQEVYDAEDTDD